MSKKCAKIFLWVSLSLMLLSIVPIIITVIMSYRHTQIYFAHDARMLAFELSDLFLSVFFFAPPLFAIELSWVRSTYKLLRYKLEGRAKVCCIISSIISFLIAMLQWLVFTSCLDLDDYGTTGSLAKFIILMAGWPVAILSFILSSIRSKEEVASKCRDDDSKKGG